MQGMYFLFDSSWAYLLLATAYALGELGKMVVLYRTNTHMPWGADIIKGKVWSSLYQYHIALDIEYK